jgi:tRNA-specific 2-thiouridylase
MLYRLGQEQLARTIFPLGELKKDQVRAKAEQLGLPVDQNESQNICFIEDDDYARFLKETCPEAVRPGPIVDKTGNILGQHEGIAFYTLGQRKGIGHHQGQPKYVIKLDPKNNTIVIGDKEDTEGTELIAERVSYVSGRAPAGPMEVTAKIRYNSPEAGAALFPEAKAKAKVIFKQPQRSITPGQSVVFYKDEEVVGGGIIN